MAPLIDMVFILLIFFLVTTTFVAETGLTVNRPEARTSENLDQDALMIGIGPAGEIYVQGQRISMISLRAFVERKLGIKPDVSAVIIADKATPADYIVRVMDELRSAGAERIALATRRENP